MSVLRPHVNIVQFLGVTEAPNPQCIITEFLDGGSLKGFLSSEKEMPLPLMKEMIHGIAAGMYHLHKEGIVHRDLAARNVLMTSNYQVKISDFGMSRRVMNETGGQTKTATGPLKWMAPECLHDRKYSVKSDVWAFGVVLFEMTTRGEPYPDMGPVDAAVAVYNKGLTLTAPKWCPPVVREIQKACFFYDPDQRPDFGAVTRYLRDMPLELWDIEEGPEKPKIVRQASIRMTRTKSNYKLM